MNERAFLGFRFYRVVRGKIVKRQVCPKAIDTMKARVREMTARSNGWSLPYVMSMLRRYLLGWQAYFRLAETPSVFATVDGWLRRRPRALIIYQSRHGRKLFRLLRARGVPATVAASAARHSRRYWAMAAQVALSMAFPGSYFDALGVPRLGPCITSTL